MTAPAHITGPEDLAQTVRNATDPLNEHSYYGTSMNASGDETSRPSEMNELLEKRRLSVAAMGIACEHYVRAHPTRSVVIAATAGAALTALLFTVAEYVAAER